MCFQVFKLLVCREMLCSWFKTLWFVISSNIETFNTQTLFIYVNILFLMVFMNCTKKGQFQRVEFCEVETVAFNVWVWKGLHGWFSVE